MAEQKKVRIIVERQDGPKEKPYNQEFEIDYRPGLNIVAALMEIQKNPVTVDGKKVPPVTWECNCLEKVCGACMMVINGKARQACCTLVDTLKQPIHLQPARTSFPSSKITAAVEQLGALLGERKDEEPAKKNRRQSDRP